MLDINIMGSKEIQSLLQQVGYGHLGCAFEGRPYFVPIQYYLAAINKTWIDALGRDNVVAIYRLRLE